MKCRVLDIKFFFKGYWPILAVILIYNISGMIYSQYSCLVEQFYLYESINKVVTWFSVLLIAFQIFLWKREGIRFSIHNIPVYFSIIFLTIIDLVVIGAIPSIKQHNIFPYDIVFTAIAFCLLLFQLLDWIFVYIDWPVSRLIRGAGRFCKCQFKKVVLKLDTEGGRRIGLMTMKVMVILLIFFGLFQIIGKIEDKKILEKSDIYQLPIEIESVNLLSFGAHINYRIEGGVSLGIDEELGDKVYITFRGVKTNVIEIDKAYLRPPTNNRYLKMDVIGFISGPHKVSVDVGMGTARYFVDQETSKKIDPKIVSDQKIGTQNYALVRIYKGKMKIEKIRIGDVEL